LNKMDRASCKSWYDVSYQRSADSRRNGFILLRSFGRHYFQLTVEQRRSIRILETGYGSGANLWMIARKGFDAHGIELWAEGVALCKKMLAHWQTQTTVSAGI
jgi:hypothetical protein